MSAGAQTPGSQGGGRRGRRGESGQDFELNLASIIDCFTVLIAFMLVSSSFVSIGILDAGVAAAGQTASKNKPPSVLVSVEMSKNDKMVVRVTGKGSSNSSIAKSDKGWDFDALGRHLASIKQRWPDAGAVTLSADGTVEYRDVVKAMEVTRKVIPVVALGGF